MARSYSEAATRLHERHCFVVMPYGKTEDDERWFKGWYKEVIERAVRQAGYEPILSSDEEHPEAIGDEVRRHLTFDPMVVVDLGNRSPDRDPNPNVMYELGIRHALNLPVVILAWDGQQLPFDISHQRVILQERDFFNLAQNKEKLVNFIKAAEAGHFYRPMDSPPVSEVGQYGDEKGQSEPQAPKRSIKSGQRLRSRAWPAISLADSIEILRRLIGELGWGERDRDTIAKVLGYAGGSSGIAGRKVAALVHFGLMDLRGGVYSPTDLARKILKEKVAIPGNLLRKAFLFPTLFREIVNRYESVGRVPRQLVLTLSLDHGIQEHVCEEVAQVFMESATYAGVLESDGFFRHSHLEGSPRALPPDLPINPAAAAQSPGDGVAITTTSAIRVLRFPVTDGQEVMLHLPSGLNEQDISLLRLQIDFLESQMRQDRLDQPLMFDFHRGDRNR